MHNLSTKQLIIALNSSIKLKLDEDFIMLLSQELNKRFLSEFKQNENTSGIKALDLKDKINWDLKTD